MYSVVLMAALTTGAQAPEFGKHGGGCSSSHGSCYSGGGYSGGCYGGGFGGGCYGSSYASGCYGSSSCHGGGHKHKHGHSSCSSSCYGGGYVGGCYGSSYGGGCYGSSYGSPVYSGGCFGGTCSGGGIIMTPPMGGTPGGTPPGGSGPKPNPNPKDKTPGGQPGGGDKVSAPATILVNLPENAKLFVDGVATTSTSANRTLVTPELPAGQQFNYNLKVETVVNGQTVVQQQQVTVQGGQQTPVAFTFSNTGVASGK